MTPRSLSRLLGAALLAVVAAAPVQAKISARAALTDFRFVLSDLNPDDGLAPSYSFLTGSAADYTGGMTASFASDAQPGSETVYWRSQILLAPGTELRILANGSTDVARTAEADSATALIRFHFQPSSVAGGPPAYFLGNALNGITETGAQEHGTLAVNAGVSNTGGASMEVTFRGLIGAWGAPGGPSAAGSLLSVAAPVSEPETYAMMLLGLGVLGGVARRRARGN